MYPGKVEELTDTRHLLKQIGFVIALLAFVFLLEKIGYVLGTIILISTIAMLLEAKPKHALIVGITVTPILWVIFQAVRSTTPLSRLLDVVAHGYTF